MDYSWKKYRSKKPITIKMIKKKFNLDYSEYIIKKRIIEYYGIESMNIFSGGLSSGPEIEFKYILEFYFGHKNVIHTFKLERKFYDFLLFNKLLIEFDGEYWHSKLGHIVNDFEKNEISKKYGFELFRVSDNEYKDPNIILHIKDKLNEIKKI